MNILIAFNPDGPASIEEEESVAGRPEFGRVAIRGTQAAFTARFVESGTQRQHMPMLVVVGNAAAMVDVSANSSATWQRAVPSLNAFSATLSVEAGRAAAEVTADPGPAGAKIAGLYMGSKPKYLVDLNRAAAGLAGHGQGQDDRLVLR